MKNKNWKTKDAEHRIILERLLRLGPLETPEIEGRIKQQSGTYKDPIREDGAKVIPHASLRNRLKELLERGEILERKSIRRSKKGLEIKRYDATRLGAIKWLSMYDEKFDEELVRNVTRDHLPLIWFRWEGLKMLFEEKTLFLALARTCLNLKVRFLRTTNIKKVPSFIQASLLTMKFVWIEDYMVELTVPQVDFDYKIREYILDYKTKGGKSLIKIHSPRKLSGMIEYGFFHGLIVEYSNQTSRKVHYNARVKFLVTLLKAEKSLYESYMYYFKKMKNQQETDKIIWKTIGRYLT